MHRSTCSFFFLIKWKSGIFYSLSKNSVRVFKRINLEQHCWTCCIRPYGTDLDIYGGYTLQWGPRLSQGPSENAVGKKHSGQTKLQGFTLPLFFLHCKCSCGKLRLEKLKHRSPSSLLAPKGQRFSGTLNAPWEHSGRSCLEGNQGAENYEKGECKCFGLVIGKYLLEAHCLITVSKNVSFITS